MKEIVGLFYIVLSAVCSCFAQSNTTDFQLSIVFEPSFSKESNLIICKAKDDNSIELTVFGDEDKKEIDFKEKAKLTDRHASEMLNFLQSYTFKIRNSRDTISSQKVLRKGDSVTAYRISIGADGITVSGTFVQASLEKKFAFWSPKKDSENHKLIERIFAISNSSFRKKKTLKYFKGLNHYFDDK